VLALKVVICVQVVGAALCFPLLMRTVTSAVITIVSAAPFVVVAAFLTGEWKANRVAAGGAYVMGWLLGLALWRGALRSPRAQAAGVAMAVLIAVGGPLAWYLRGEFVVQSDAVVWENVGHWGPLFGAMVVSGLYEWAKGPWLLMGAHVLLGLTAMVLGRTVWKGR